MSSKLSNNRDRIVNTHSGKRAKRSDCKRIKNEFYIVGDSSVYNSGECYLVDSKYHRANNGKIEFDFEKNQYVLIHKNHLKYGVVGCVDSKPLLGYYTPNLTKNIVLNSTETKIEFNNCISEEVAKELGYIECYADGKFYLKTEKNANFFKKIGKSPISKSGLPYDSRFASSMTSTNFDAYFDPKFDNKNLNNLGDFLEDNGITFGIEFETTTGYIPERICYKYGLIALRDGSISGLEYVTIPYSGRKGVYALKAVCSELTKRTKFDLSCALHIHVGGLDRTVTKILSSFILGMLTQDQMFNLQPAYKRGGMGIKGKDYCSPLNHDIYKALSSKITNVNVKSEFKNLFNFISDGRCFSEYDNDLSNIESHPSDPEGNRKWNIHSRYKWLNFVPIVFGNKKTLEFRHHSATFDFEKVINFLFTCGMFIKIANSSSTELLNKESSLVKSLTQKPQEALKTLNDLLLSSGETRLSDIISRNNTYNSIRLSVMDDMKAKEDYTGANEARYNARYLEKLKPSFWE